MATPFESIPPPLNTTSAGTDGELLVQPRARRGRPRINEPKPLYTCPFSDPKRVDPCQKAPGPKNTIKDHLRRIQRKNVECSVPQSDKQHPANDPLWDTPEVSSLTQIRVPQTIEEKHASRKFQAAKIRQGNQMKLDELERRLQLEVDAGRMTLDSMEDELLAANPLSGVAKDKFELQILRRRLSVYEKAGDELPLVQAAHERTTKAENMAGFYERKYLELSAFLPALFNPSQHLTNGNYLARFGFTWPTAPSTASYFLIHAMVVPPGLWPSTGPPVNQKDYEHCANVMHPDLVLTYIEMFGTEEIALQVLRVYNNSKDLIERQRQASDDSNGTRLALFEEHNKEWEVVKAKMQGPRLMSSDMISILLMARTVDEAAGWTRMLRFDEEGSEMRYED